MPKRKNATSTVPPINNTLPSVMNLNSELITSIRAGKSQQVKEIVLKTLVGLTHDDIFYVINPDREDDNLPLLAKLTFTADEFTEQDIEKIKTAFSHIDEYCNEKLTYVIDFKSMLKLKNVAENKFISEVIPQLCVDGKIHREGLVCSGALSRSDALKVNALIKSKAAEIADKEGKKTEHHPDNKKGSKKNSAKEGNGALKTRKPDNASTKRRKINPPNLNAPSANSDLAELVLT